MSRCLRLLEAKGYVWPLVFSLAYGHLGDMDQALHYLERTYEERAAWFFLPGAPTFDIFRGEPRFEAIATRISVRGTSSGRGSRLGCVFR